MQDKDQRKYLPLVLAFLFWVFCFFLVQPDSLFKLEYVVILLLAAPLWLIPMAFQVLGMSQSIQKMVIPIVLLFAVSFLFEIHIIC